MINFNTIILLIAQISGISTSIGMVLLGGIIGKNLAPSDSLATLPAAMLIGGSAFSSAINTRVLDIFGRKKISIILGAIAFFGLLICSYGLEIRSFSFFCIGSFIVGTNLAAVLQYRFYIMEFVNPDKIKQAVPFLLSGSLVASYLGPNLSTMGKSLFGQELYTGSFLLIASMFLVSLPLMFFLPKSTINKEDKRLTLDQKNIDYSFKNLKYFQILAAGTASYLIMSFIMTATSISMFSVEGFSLEDTKTVIQSHVMAMFIPSLFSGIIYKYIRPESLIKISAVLYIFCIAGIIFEASFLSYLIPLILLGVGWNFMFTSATILLPHTFPKELSLKAQSFNDFFIVSSQAVAAFSAGFVLLYGSWSLVNIIALIPTLIIFGWFIWSPTIELINSTDR